MIPANARFAAKVWEPFNPSMSTPTITTDHFVLFYSNTIYSNFHWTDSQFFYRRACAPMGSSEVGLMYEKAVFFDDIETSEKILYAGSSFEVKALGRQVRDYVDKEWECVRFGLMQNVLLSKFSQNPEWAAELKATGNRTLVECSKTDGIWGVKLDIDEAAKHVENSAFTGASVTWPGQNLLGQALMQVRSLV